ncbi:hypothetical protein A2996_01890 [Candidatus Campbellbacteria bacterium RIFCSPLOWO2_01_FULL_34_15]|jgi:REP element-mobilizing transposase RayT|uniref:Transposase IS200-like domain-containing protein n=2 Tax=Candidatus Campbelliibacteriota TaxID=1752727 RepID=A0A1F5EPW9_9BACT|nr:MAG: hypothetical protein A2811_00270 [Candidatus Campbellbacteria bacterium RIFCSPHIGHO2_01_FULL_34_10]OGD69433.1 MAG: hypothetical protein A2996_01890 [Candidatus Campbellbacteria bacterium RIFCSPLOWO2_01_FULL_34_15]
MRNIKFANNEYYHVYNRGVDKRRIFGDKNDLWRFIKGILVFNRNKPVGSIRDELRHDKICRDSVPANFNSVDFKKLIDSSGDLVEFVCLCLNPNHYHFLVKQTSDGGVSKFIHKLASGYTSYFNEKKDRSGALFQGKFKAKLIETNEQLLYTSGYINLNYEIHEIEGDDMDLVFSSWNEYAGKNNVMNICKGKSVVLEQFKGFDAYKDFVREVVIKAKKFKEDLKKEHLE